MIELMNDELGGKIMTEFVGIRLKTYYQLINDGSGDKKVKGIKKCIIKKRLKFENCFQKTINKRCLQNNKITLRSQQRFKSGVHNVFAKEVKRIAVIMIRD